MRTLNNKNYNIKEYFKNKYFRKRPKRTLRNVLRTYTPTNKLNWVEVDKNETNNRLYGRLYPIQYNRVAKKKFRTSSKEFRFWSVAKKRFIIHQTNFRSWSAESMPEIGRHKQRGQLISRKSYSKGAFVVNWHGISRFRFLDSFKESLGIQLRKMKSFFFSPLNMQKVFRKKRYFSDFLKKKLNLLRMRLFYGIFYHSRFFRFLHDRANATDYQTHLYSLMERRLDVLLLRMGFVNSIYLAQQMVRHGKMKVNGRIIRNFYKSVNLFDKVYFASKVIEDEMRFIYFSKLTRGKLPVLPSYLIFDFNFFFFYVRPMQNLKEIKLPFNLSSRHLSVR